MTPSLAAPMISHHRTPTKKAKCTNLLRIELNRRMELKMTHQENTKTVQPSDRKMMVPSPSVVNNKTQEFGPESYLTPRRSLVDSESSFDSMPPPLLRKIDYSCDDRNNYLRVRRDGVETSSIMIPLIGSSKKRDNQGIQISSPFAIRRTTLFRLQPRAEDSSIACDGPPHFKRKVAPATTRDAVPDFSLRRQTTTSTSTTKSNAVTLNTMQAAAAGRNNNKKLSYYKHFPSVGHLSQQAYTTTRMKPMGRSLSYTAMSA